MIDGGDPLPRNTHRRPVSAHTHVLRLNPTRSQLTTTTNTSQTQPNTRLGPGIYHRPPTSVIPRHILLQLQFSIVFFFSIKSNPSESIGGWEWEERGASLSPTQTLLHRTLLASAVLDSSLIFSPPLDRLVFVLVVALRLLIVVQ